MDHHMARRCSAMSSSLRYPGQSSPHYDNTAELVCESVPNAVCSALKGERYSSHEPKDVVI